MGTKKGRKAPKIDVTPEMVAAGAFVLNGAVDGCDSLEGIAQRVEAIAAEVYMAMAKQAAEQRVLYK